MGDKKYDMHIEGEYFDKDVPCQDQDGNELSQGESQDLADWMDTEFPRYRHTIQERKEDA
jgi:hypothetical protein